MSKEVMALITGTTVALCSLCRSCRFYFYHVTCWTHAKPNSISESIKCRNQMEATCVRALFIYVY